MIILFTLKNFRVTILTLYPPVTSKGEFKSWNHTRRETQLTDNLYYKLTPNTQAAPKK